MSDCRSRIGCAGKHKPGTDPHLSRTLNTHSLPCGSHRGIGFLGVLSCFSFLGVLSCCRAVALRPDSTIVVLGHFSTADGGQRDIDIGVLQFDNGGSLDQTFSGDGVALLRYSNSGGDEADFARDLVLRPDVKAVLLGHTVSPNPGSPHRRALLGQVNLNGSLDLSFGTGGMVNDAFGFGFGFSASSSFDSIDLDASGRIVVAGARSAASAYAPFRAGNGFRLAIPRSILPETDTRLLISAATATSGYVANSGSNLAIPFSVTPDIVTRLTLPIAVEVAGTGDTIEENFY